MLDSVGVAMYLVVMGAAVYEVMVAVRHGLAAHHGLTWLTPVSSGELLTSARQLALGTALIVLSTVVHELGHVVGRWVTGTGPVQLVAVGFHPRLFGDKPSSSIKAVVVLAMGPVAGLAYGTGLLVLGWSTSPVLIAAAGLAGLIAIVNLLPLLPGSDGAQIRRVLCGRTPRPPRCSYT